MRAISIAMLGIVIGCGADTRDAPAAPAPAPQPPPPPIAKPLRTMAVMKFVDSIEECSNAGGEHVWFASEPGAPRRLLAHAGGHAMHLGFGGIASHVLPQVKAYWVVAELMLDSRPDEDHDGNPDSSVSGWCLDRMPRHFDAEVVRLWLASSEDDAHRLAAVVDAKSIELAPATRIAEWSIARVHNYVEYPTLRYALDPVSGHPPATIDTKVKLGTTNFVVGPGDLVVVGTDASGTAIRALEARTRADAEERAATLRARGWPSAVPTQPIFTSWFAETIVPEHVIGEVFAAATGCGLDVILGPHERGGAPRHAAAPRGATIGERLAATVELQILDRCGRELAVTRAYRVDAAGQQIGDALVE
jgi:hypothetical protein